MQEVTNVEFLNSLRAKLGADKFGYVMMPTGDGREEYAWVYRLTGRLEIGEVTGYPDEQNNFSRPPAMLPFRYSGFDCVLLNYHADPNQAQREFNHIGDVVAHARTIYNEPDILVCGDFNLDPRTTRTESGLLWIPPTDADTTVRGDIITMDNIGFTKASIPDISSGSVYHFDAQKRFLFFGTKHRRVSNHRPVFAEVFARLRDDDFYEQKDTPFMQRVLYHLAKRSLG